jgi:hypothetical protein
VSGDGPSITKSARLTVDSAHLLVQVVGATTSQVPDLDERLGDLHETAARLAEEISDRLVSDLVLPFERADLHRISRTETHSVHTLLRASRTLLADRTRQSPPTVSHGADEVLRATELLVVATAALRKPSRLPNIARETGRIHLDLERTRQHVIGEASVSSHRGGARRAAEMLAVFADVVADITAVIGDMRILAAGAGRL